LAAEIVSQAGYDCVMIDLEHGPGSVLDAIGQMQAIQGRDCTALLRVPENSPLWLKKVLDAGVGGVMVPAVNSATEAKAAVAACRYAPRGMRGMAATVVRASNYGADWKDYIGRAEAELLILCQIESRAAVEAAADIAGVDGVDMIFVGPFDLSASLGHLGQPDHPEVRAAIAAVEKAAKAAGKLLGAIPTPERSAKDLYDAGYDLVLADSDVALLRDGTRRGCQALREAAGRS
jgi:4-hydroxy-2-oxoheptanedioate aldolase